MAKAAASKEKPLTKLQLFTSMAETTGLNKKQIAEVFEALKGEIGKAVGKKGPGVFSIPGLMKVQVIRKPATKATTRKNPFKPDEMMEVKAKPARNVVKVRPLKSLKEMA